MLDNWQRIEQIIKWAGSASVSAFAREIGLNKGENLYQIKRGNNGISKGLADIITSKYPQISKAWLLTGEGEMIYDGTAGRISIPYYETDVLNVVLSENPPKPSSQISIPMFKGCDFAALSFSAAMAPEIPKGAVLLFEITDPTTFIPGGLYMVVSERFTGMRRLRQEPGSSQVRLVPSNKEEFDEMLIEIDEIKNLFLIRGIIINKSL